MSFLYPNVLYALFIPVLLALVAWIMLRQRSKRWEVLVSQQHINELVHRSSRWGKILPLVLGLLSLVFIIPSLARPYSGQRETEEIRRGHNIIIAIDCSRSMQARDVTPSRLDRAKTAAYDLLDDLPEDKFGLIIFSGEAHLLMPLTHDHNSLKESIEQLEYGWISMGGTNLEDVVSLALKTFNRDKTQDTTNALIVLSDGEDTVNAQYNTAIQAKEDHLIVVTAGIGTLNGDVIPDSRQPDGIYRDRRGQQVLTKLDPAPLQLLANETDGQYIQLNDGKELTRYVKQIAERLNREEGMGEKKMVPNDRYYIFAIPSLICLILALITGTKWRAFRKSHLTKTSILLVLLVLTYPIAHAGEKEEKQARSAFTEGYNQLKAQKDKEATKNFSKSLLSSDNNIQTASHYNLGNVTAHNAFAKLAQPQQKEDAQLSNANQQQQDQIGDEQIKEAEQLLTNAIEHYDDALAVNKSYAPALNNKKKIKEYLKKLKEEQKRREEQKKKQEQQKKDKDKDKQDQGKQGQDKQDKNGQDKQDQDKQDKDDQGKQGQDKQDKGNQGKQGQDKQDKGDQGKQDQDKQDKGDQGKQDQDKQDKGDQGKQDQDKQDKGDQGKQGQDKQSHQPGLDEKSNSKPDMNVNPNKEGQSQLNQGSEKKNQDLQIAEIEESKEDKERKEAARILKERSDAEKGSPIPQRPINWAPDKDY
ncbi:MAG: VWA domain-containing protein [Akkermansia sp.]